MRRTLTLLCTFAIVFSLVGCAPASVPVFEYNCLGKNGTCPVKQTNPLDFFCDSCDPDHDNIEGIKKASASPAETPDPAPSDDAVPPEAAEPSESPEVPDSTEPSDTPETPADTQSPAEETPEPEEPVPPSTPEEEQALAAAKDHLASATFSRTGLIKQLKSDGFSAAEAAYAADNCGADWFEQAEKAAEKHLARSPFTLDLLVKQLELDGFTAEEAEQGAAEVYNIPMYRNPSKPTTHHII